MTLDFSPTEKFSINSRVDVNNDNYTESQYGLTNAHGWTASVDVSYAFTENLSANTFYTYERMSSTEWSRSFNNQAAAVSTADLDWTNLTVDSTDTLGAGLQYKGLLKGKLTLAANLIFVSGNTEITTRTGSALAAALPLPDLHSDLNIIDINGNYIINKHSSLRFAYLHQELSSQDWGYDDVTATTLSNVIGTNQTSPAYTDNVFGVSYIYSFRM